MSKGKPKGKFY